ncbi:MAG: hypothetical protein K9M75_07475 [Phycisphaerae bacterium]|nr:hypothetical protein [Phycisphaerae bacterium]
MVKINENSMSFLPATLIVMSLTLAAVTCAKVVISKTETAKISGNIDLAVSAGQMDDDEVKKYHEKFASAVAILKKKSVFAPSPQAKTNPVKSVEAIMGDEALINNKWYKAGESIGEAKIVKVASAEVTVLWNGKETKLSPISAPTNYAIREKPQPVKDPHVVQAKAVESDDHGTQNTQITANAVTEDEFAWIGVKISPELKARFLEQWNKLSDEQKTEGKERWQAMPDGQKQMYVDQMEMRMKSGQL